MFDVGLWRRDASGNLYETPNDGDQLTGLDKLIQRVCVSLLQERDTVKYTFGKRVPPGCTFMTALRSGEVRSEMDVSAQFFLARHFLFVDLKQSETPVDPPEERFQDIHCRGIAILPGVLKLKLHIKSQTDEVTVWLPIAMPK